VPTTPVKTLTGSRNPDSPPSTSLSLLLRDRWIAFSVPDSLAQQAAIAMKLVGGDAAGAPRGSPTPDVCTANSTEPAALRRATRCAEQHVYAEFVGGVRVSYRRREQPIVSLDRTSSSLSIVAPPGHASLSLPPRWPRPQPDVLVLTHSPLALFMNGASLALSVHGTDAPSGGSSKGSSSSSSSNIVGPVLDFSSACRRQAQLAADKLLGTCIVYQRSVPTTTDLPPPANGAKSAANVELDHHRLLEEEHIRALAAVVPSLVIFNPHPYLQANGAAVPSVSTSATGRHGTTSSVMYGGGKGIEAVTSALLRVIAQAC